MKDLDGTFSTELDQLFKKRDFKGLKELLCTVDAPDVAEILADTAPPERVFLFRLLPKDTAIAVFEFLGGAEREELLASFTDSEAAVILEEMSDDDRTALFDELPAKTVKKLLAGLSPEERKLANALLHYPSGSAGRIMTPEFVDLREDMTVAQALRRIRAKASSKETIYTSFVTGNDRRLKGTVSLEDLILAEPESSVAAIMNPHPVFIFTSTDQEEASQIMSRYDVQAMPVVDFDTRLVGIVTFDDILDIIQEEATEDFERLAGIRPVEETYLSAGILTLAWKRIPWLVVCIVTQIFSSCILRRYAFALESSVALAFFIPLLTDTGGNTGTQSTTLVIRGFTLGEISGKDLPRILLKEILSGLVLGSVLAGLAFLRAWSMEAGLDLAMAVAVSVAAVVMLGNVTGAILPFAARHLGMDPAVMSAPFITTVVDIMGLLVYFETARRFLGLE